MEHDYYERKLLRSEFSMKVCCGCFIAMIFLLLIAGILSGCKQVEYVPVVEHHTEYVAKTDTFIQKDSVFCHDSVFVHMKGDTVWFERWRTQFRDRWHERIVTDTLMRADSIPVPYPVEKRLTRWQQVKQDYGGWAIGILLALIVAIILTTGFWKRVVRVIRYF